MYFERSIRFWIPKKLRDKDSYDKALKELDDKVGKFKY